jgi:maleate isomerase
MEFLAMSKTYRIGQIVPSSNTTMETEIPAMLLARQTIRPERFTFHSSRMRMKKVVKEELAAMDAESDRCALELSDARVDVLGYACLVAIMAMGHGYHRVSQKRLHERTVENGGSAPVITSAGALVDALKVIGAKRIVVVAPYMKPLTELVVDYIRHEGYEVLDYRALEIPDNLEVGRHDPSLLPGIVSQMNTIHADAVASRGGQGRSNDGQAGHHRLDCDDLRDAQTAGTRSGGAWRRCTALRRLLDKEPVTSISEQA